MRYNVRTLGTLDACPSHTTRIHRYVAPGGCAARCPARSNSDWLLVLNPTDFGDVAEVGGASVIG
jgi:hypothetical protein